MTARGRGQAIVRLAGTQPTGRARAGSRRPSAVPHAPATPPMPRRGASAGRSSCRRRARLGDRGGALPAAWLRGRFLARGSLSLSGVAPISSSSSPRDEAVELAGRLADVGLPASWRLRRGLGVVDLEERGVDRAVPRPHRREREPPGARGKERRPQPPRRAQPGHQRGVREPPAERRGRRPAAGRDRRARGGRTAPGASRAPSALSPRRGARRPRRRCPRSPPASTSTARRSSVRSTGSSAWPSTTTRASGNVTRRARAPGPQATPDARPGSSGPGPNGPNGRGGRPGPLASIRACARS